jgi:hypothetical protein
MEELEQYLEVSAQDVDGVLMVPLSMAIQAVQTASNIKMLESLDSVMADLHKTLLDADLSTESE